MLTACPYQYNFYRIFFIDGQYWASSTFDIIFRICQKSIFNSLWDCNLIWCGLLRLQLNIFDVFAEKKINRNLTVVVIPVFCRELRNFLLPSSKNFSFEKFSASPNEKFFLHDKALKNLTRYFKSLSYQIQI